MGCFIPHRRQGWKSWVKSTSLGADPFNDGSCCSMFTFDGKIEEETNSGWTIVQSQEPVYEESDGRQGIVRTLARDCGYAELPFQPPLVDWTFCCWFNPSVELKNYTDCEFGKCYMVCGDPISDLHFYAGVNCAPFIESEALFSYPLLTVDPDRGWMFAVSRRSGADHHVFAYYPDTGQLDSAYGDVDTDPDYQISKYIIKFNRLTGSNSTHRVIMSYARLFNRPLTNDEILQLAHEFD